LEKCGIEVLHNSNTIFKSNDTSLQLVGVGDIWAKECDSEAAFDGARANTPTILLSHNPDSKDHLSEYSWNLMLSGHTHGGQLLVPLIGTTPYAPVQDHRYVAGLKEWGNRFINVSRGVGSIEGIRFNCRPDVTLLEIS
jgi:predicted MPP superfamily phosphohydrolase